MQRALDNNENDKSFIHNSYPNTIIMIFKNHKEITAVISIVPIILTFHFFPMSPFLSLPPSVSLILLFVFVFITFHYFPPFSISLFLILSPSRSSFISFLPPHLFASILLSNSLPRLCFSFRPPFLI